MRMRNIKLLIVEDEEIVAFDIESILHNLGYEICDIVSSAEEAIASASRCLPDLILMDIMLKGSMDGIQAAAEIHKCFDIPIVYLSAYGDTNTIERAKLTEPFGYLLKPFTEKELHTVIEIALTRHHAEQKVRQALETEKELSKLKSLFVANASHEFRTPLTTIRSSVDLLELYSNGLMDEQKNKHFQRINLAIEQLLQLLDDLLVIGKAESGKLDFNPVPLNLLEFSQNLVEELQINVGIQYSLKNFNNSLYLNPDSQQLPILERDTTQTLSWQNEANLESDTPKRIVFTYQGNFANASMDEKLLHKILTNLLSNAIKYSLFSDIVRFDLDCEDEIVTFRIQDQGIGIALEDQPQLFEPFYRAANVGKIKGTGLGLSIVKKCVELHGGLISVESQVGIGSTFIVKLPLVN
ncbi:MAG: ATP-binding protein [Coleofasciculaceae cyanobacterium]